jgi:hypothetical protein
MLNHAMNGTSSSETFQNRVYHITNLRMPHTSPRDVGYHGVPLKPCSGLQETGPRAFLSLHVRSGPDFSAACLVRALAFSRLCPLHLKIFNPG